MQEYPPKSPESQGTAVNHTAGSNAMAAGQHKKSFITEVEHLMSLSRNHAKSTGNEDIRPAEGANEVFQIIDKMAEKQQRSKRIRTMLQRAAHRTILVVRTKNSIQAADVVTVRFSQHKATEVPRIVELPQICNKVLRHTRFASTKKRIQFQTLFSESREVDALLKDMFWYITAHCLQPGRQPHLEAKFYQRIADSFTALFVRLQMKKASRDTGFFDQLPDVMAQILFVALYEAFPRSRKDISSGELKREILRTCHSWILGFVPAELSCEHWVTVDQDSPKRIAELAEFPAMRNRMIRAERVERTRQAVRTWHDDQDDDFGETLVISEQGSGELLATGGQETTESSAQLLPHLHQKQYRNSAFSILPATKKVNAVGTNNIGDGSSKSAAHVETRERYTYEMCHSPLIGAFLARHQLQANTPRLRVQMRLTSGKQRALNEQEVLRPADGVVPARRRRLVDPSTFGDALVELQSFGDSVRDAYSQEKDRARNLDSRERKQLADAHRVLENQHNELRQSGERMHAFSNQLVSKANIDDLVVTSPRGKAAVPAAGRTLSDANSSTVPGAIRPFTPRPPPSRRGDSNSASSTT